MSSIWSRPKPPLFQHLTFKSGQSLSKVSQSFKGLYIVNAGFLKTVTLDDCGNEHVWSFPMKGDLLGLDSIFSRDYASETVALSSCDLILVPAGHIRALSDAQFEENVLYGMISRELMRRREIISTLAVLRAEVRVARFLMSLVERSVEIGCPVETFTLQMSRKEIGSYLGLTFQTVSRILSAFNQKGLVTVHRRRMTINDLEALKALQGLARLRTSRTVERSACMYGEPK